MTSRSLTSALLLLPLLSLCGCAPPTRDLQIIVRAGPVPTGAAALQVQTSLGGQQAAMPLRFDIGTPPKTETTFGLTLPADARGAFLIEVQAQDGAGCGVGRGSTQVQVDRVAPAEVRVVLVATGCLGADRLRIDSAVPQRARSSGGTEVILRGVGFLPGAKVRFAGKEARVTVRSDGEIAAILPPGPPGRPTIEIENLDGSKGSRGDLFTYSATTLRFQAVAIRVDESPTELSAGDLDGDGAADVAVSTGLTVQVVTGDGRGMVRTLARARYPTDANMRPTAGVQIADLDGDGKGDLFGVQERTLRSYLFQQGTLSLQDPLPLLVGIPNSDFFTALASDVDGNGSQDFVLAAGVGADTRLEIFSARTGTPSVQTLTGCAARGAAMGDLDRDRRPDLALLCAGAMGFSGLRVAWNDGGRFTLGDPLAPTTVTAGRLRLGAFSAPGTLDAALYGGLAMPRAVASLGPLPGTRSLRHQMPMELPGYVGGATAAADLDLDGLDDLIVSIALGGDLAPPPITHLAVLPGQPGTGPRDTPGGLFFFSPGPALRHFVVADLDRDGLPDLIVAPATSDRQILVLYNVSS